jgi:hypothetical protein
MIRMLMIVIVSVLMGGLFASSEAAPPSAATADQSFERYSYDVPARSSSFLVSLGIATPEAAIAQQRCCKVCTTGKACGNTCIARDKQCHVGPGCACDG